jgi:predicted transposase YbfD/YdcC
MLEDLLNHLCAVDDPRQVAKIEHRLVDVLAISVCAVLAVAESFEDIALYGEAKRPWLSRHLDLAGGVPSHDTVRRVLMMIDPGQFEDAFLAWTRAAFGPADAADAPRQVAIDGKTLRRSFDRRGQRTPLHLVSAFATREGVVLAQRRAVGGKADRGRAGGGGEQGVLPDLVAGMDLRGTLASLDAGFCHPRTADAITAHGGDCLVALKGNCPSLHAPVRDWFDAHAFEIGGGLRPCTDDIEERHGRLTRRRTFVAEIEALIAGRPEAGGAIAAWPGLRRMVAVEAIRMVEHPPPGVERTVTAQVRCFLTSSDASPESLAMAVRAHWAIENGLHWVLDTGFGEDHSRVRHENAMENLAVPRRIALNLVRADPSPESLKVKRKRAAWDDAFMQKVVLGNVHA